MRLSESMNIGKRERHPRCVCIGLQAALGIEIKLRQALSGTGMATPMNLLELDFVHVRVQLGGGHIGMTEKLLDNT